MGQIATTYGQSLILTATDRLQSTNAGAGMSVASANVILLGEDAGRNITGSRLILLGKGAGKNSTLNDLIVIGENSFDQGVTLAAATKSLVIGNASLRAWNATASGDTTTLPMLVIGHNVAPLMVKNNGSVMIGNDIMTPYVASGGTGTFGGNVLIGYGVANGALIDTSNTLGNSIIIGCRAGKSFFAMGVNNCIIMGKDSANFDNATGGQISGCIIIGNGTNGPGTRTLTSCIILGDGVVTDIATVTGVAVGYNAFLSGADCVIIGSGTRGPGQSSILAHPDYNIVIGSQNGDGANFANDIASLILLGPHLRDATYNYAPSAIAGDFLVANGVLNRTLLYGNVSNGNLTLGNDLANRAVGTGASNCLKIINGKRITGGAGSVGGAYLYSDDGTTFAAGDLRAVTPAGADWDLTPVAGTVAALPAVATVPVGQRRVVTNALAPAYGVAVAGGGTVVQSVMANGVAWVCM